LHDYIDWVPNRGACIDACLSVDVTRSKPKKLTWISQSASGPPLVAQNLRLNWNRFVFAFLFTMIAWKF